MVKRVFFVYVLAPWLGACGGDRFQSADDWTEPPDELVDWEQTEPEPEPEPEQPASGIASGTASGTVRPVASPAASGGLPSVGGPASAAEQPEQPEPQQSGSGLGLDDAGLAGDAGTRDPDAEQPSGMLPDYPDPEQGADYPEPVTECIGEVFAACCEQGAERFECGADPLTGQFRCWCAGKTLAVGCVSGEHGRWACQP